ncbi:MAG: radical SAM protein [Nitrospirota bacterium]
MKVCEIFTSIQGESSYAGLPCTFIRLTGCNLRCSYCDTKYAYDAGIEMTIDEITDQVLSAGVRLVEITGGEPLLQEKETLSLISNLIKKEFKVLIETNGSASIRDIDKQAVIILDIKTPGSGMSEKMDFSNLGYIKPSDEIKFVICDRADYDWSKKIISEHNLNKKCEILFSPVYAKLNPLFLARWIIEDRLDVRLNLQIHKYIFGAEERKV